MRKQPWHISIWLLIQLVGHYCLRNACDSSSSQGGCKTQVASFLFWLEIRWVSSKQEGYRNIRWLQHDDRASKQNEKTVQIRKCYETANTEIITKVPTNHTQFKSSKYLVIVKVFRKTGAKCNLKLLWIDSLSCKELATSLCCPRLEGNLQIYP